MSRAQNLIDMIPHSNTQERIAETFVTQTFHGAGILPGEATQTKFESMQALREMGNTSSHDVHQGTQISWGTYHEYKSKCTAFVTFARVECGLRKNIPLTPEMAGNFLQFALTSGISNKTFQNYASAIEKFAYCYDKEQAPAFHTVIDEYKKLAPDELAGPENATRAYDNPQAIIEALPDEKLKVVAELQLTCGLRISDACHISPMQWDGSALTVNSKGGQEITVHPSAGLAARISAIVEAEGSLSVNRNAYSYQLEKACQSCGENWNGSHGLRHNFAQHQMEVYTSEGKNYHEALRLTSEDLGHHRPDITLVYLR